MYFGVAPPRIEPTGPWSLLSGALSYNGQEVVLPDLYDEQTLVISFGMGSKLRALSKDFGAYMVQMEDHTEPLGWEAYLLFDSLPPLVRWLNGQGYRVQ